MKTGKRKIAYVSGTRADYGLINPVLKLIERSSRLASTLYITGMHLMPRFGESALEVEIEHPGCIRINSTFDGNDEATTAFFNGKLINGLVGELRRNRPDMMLVLGDRSEMVAVALTCVSMGIPVGHIHGGDVTRTKDEIFRHAITKLSHLHFCTTSGAAKRIVNMGEDEWRVYQVGAPGLCEILNERLPSRYELCNYLDVNPQERYVLVLQHPVSGEVGEAGRQMTETIEAVKGSDLPVIVIYPNADAGRDEMIDVIERERTNPRFRIYPNLERRFFLALEREAAVWVGNSSAGVIESASFKTPVVDIGTRQHGRERGINVVHASYDRSAIELAMKKCLYDSAFRKHLELCTNPWGDGQTARRIVDVLEKVSITPDFLSKTLNYEQAECGQNI